MTDLGEQRTMGPMIEETWEQDVQDLLVHGRDREAADLAVRHLGDPTDRPSTTEDPMQPRDQFEQVGALLGEVAGGIRSDQLDAATPCAAFAVRGVLGHMIEGATVFAAAFRGEPAPSLDGDPAAGDDVVPRAAAALGELFAAVGSPGALERTIDSPFGAVPGDEFVRYLALDGLVHGWDVATATGQPYRPSDALVAEVDAYARRLLTTELRDGDTFADATEPPEGATPIERLAAFTGRTVPPTPATPAGAPNQTRSTLR